MSSATSDGSLPQYRSISWAAILAFLLSVAAALALFNPLCLAIAIAAAGLALFALRQIGAQPDVLSGRRLALTALFISIFFAIFVPTRLGMRSRVLQKRGEELAEAFFGLLQEGKMYEAHQLSGLRYSKPGESPDPDADSSKVTSADFKGFEETQSIQAVKRIDNKFSFHLEGVEPSRTYSAMEVFVFRYRLVPDAGTGKKSFPLWIVVGRHLDRKSGMPIWRIMDLHHTHKEDAH